MVASRYGLEEEKRSIWVLLEHTGSGPENVSLELLCKARQLADEADWPLVALVLGYQIHDFTQVGFAYGADEVWIVEHPLLEDFTVEAYTHAAYQALLQGKPSVFLCGATTNGRDLAGRLAVRLRTGLNADCTDLNLDPESGLLTSEVTGFGGGVLALLQAPEHRPQMSTVRPGVFTQGKPDFTCQGEVREVSVELNTNMIFTRVVERVVGQGVDLTQAPVLVCGGRGIEGNFEMLRELASLLEGEVGATRPPVDEGHIGRERQVGQTGVVCRPKLAIACGISGAFHFVVGIQEADTVVAINLDPEAPIFEFSDYCIVGDVFQVVPALVQSLSEGGEGTHA